MKLVISEGTWLVLEERKEVEKLKETFPIFFLGQVLTLGVSLFGKDRESAKRAGLGSKYLVSGRRGKSKTRRTELGRGGFSWAELSWVECIEFGFKNRVVLCRAGVSWLNKI